MRAAGAMGVLVALVTACSGYRPGAFADARGPFTGATRTVGCLDVAVAAGRDATAEGPVARYTIANRCDAATWVDLTAVTAIARFSDGSSARLRAFDPRGELRPAELDARRIARENIEYRLPADRDEWPVELCLDLTALDMNVAGGERALVCERGV